MTFIKSLRRKRKEKGQAALEYFIIFALVAVVTIWAFVGIRVGEHRDRGPLRRIIDSLQGMPGVDGLFQKAVGPQGLNIENQ